MPTGKETPGPGDMLVNLTTSPPEPTGEVELHQSNPNGSAINDFELVNVLYVNYFPFVSDSAGETPTSLSETLKSWQAWECSESERQAAQNLHSGRLPADQSVVSAMKRLAYRAKVIDWLRGGAAWLTKVGVNITQPLSEVVKRTEAPLAILNSLAGRYAPKGTAREQFRVVLKPISRLIALGESGIKQKYFITHTQYEYDSVLKAFTPKIKVNSLYVRWDLVEEKGNADSVKINYGFADYILQFDPEMWNRAREEIKDGFLDKGYEVLRERSLALVIPPQ